jgi:hypothetical protein
MLLLHWLECESILRRKGLVRTGHGVALDAATAVARSTPIVINVSHWMAPLFVRSLKAPHHGTQMPRGELSSFAESNA